MPLEKSFFAMTKERRKFKRIGASFPIEFLVADAGAGEAGSWEKGITENVSVRGVLVHHGGKSELSAGGRVKLRLLIPGKFTKGFSDMTLRGEGWIVRVSKKGKKRFLAIEFGSPLEFGNFF